jgi:hypothetical protein
MTRKLADVVDEGLGPAPGAPLLGQLGRWQHDGRGDARRVLARRRAGLVAAGTALAATVVVLVLAVHSSSTRLPQATTPAAQLRPAPQPIVFDVPASGGARRIELEPDEIVAAEPGSRGDVARPLPSHTRISLAEGTLDVSLRQRPGKTWAVNAGPYRVDVVGTRFRVTWRAAAQSFEVAVDHGRVRVSGGRLGMTGRELGPGDVFSAGPEAPSSIEPTPAREPERVGSSAGVPPNWKTLRRERRYQDALAAAEQLGFDELCATLGPADLAALADVSRLAGNRRRAEQALTSLRGRHPGTREAATAAFLLGRQGTTPVHSRWLEAYLAEQPGGPYEQEALGRLMTAHHQRGDRALARSRARQYLASYPGGSYESHARSILAEAKTNSIDP